MSAEEIDDAEDLVRIMCRSERSQSSDWRQFDDSEEMVRSSCRSTQRSLSPDWWEDVIGTPCTALKRSRTDTPAPTAPQACGGHHSNAPPPNEQAFGGGNDGVSSAGGGNSGGGGNGGGRWVYNGRDKYGGIYEQYVPFDSNVVVPAASPSFGRNLSNHFRKDQVMRNSYLQTIPEGKGSSASSSSSSGSSCAATVASSASSSVTHMRVAYPAPVSLAAPAAPRSPLQLPSDVASSSDEESDEEWNRNHYRDPNRQLSITTVLLSIAKRLKKAGEHDIATSWCRQINHNSRRAEALAFAMQQIDEERVRTDPSGTRFKVGITHCPTWRFRNEKYGYIYEDPPWGKMEVVWAASNVEHARWLETALITHYKKRTTPGLANKKPGGKPRQPSLRASCTLFLPLEKESDVEKINAS
jgi:hypothetical protein